MPISENRQTFLQKKKMKKKTPKQKVVLFVIGISFLFHVVSEISFSLIKVIT